MSTPSHSAASAVGVRPLPLAVRRFLNTEAAGGVVLVVAATVALAWANSPWNAAYEDLWHATVTLRIGPIGIDDDLRHIVNDGLMALFFLVVGLEIKRELVAGDLRDPRTAALPALAAVGGMVVPAALYLAVNVGAAGTSGWGIPMATDIAFAVGVLALLGSRVSAGLKLFLLTLAVVDDIGAIAIIAAFYTDDLDVAALAIAVACLGAATLCVRARVWAPAVYVALGVACWLATYESGVHATLAGVAFGLLAPARPRAPAEVARDWAGDLSDEPSAGEMQSLTAVAKETVSVAERVQHQLHPLTSFVVVPIFALANAGVRVSGDALEAPGAGRVAAGVALGLLVGKAVGVTAASALAVRLRLGTLPPGVTWPQVLGVATVAGVGFTVSLFVAGLAFDDPSLEDGAKLAVLVASVVASLSGAAVLAIAARGGGRAGPGPAVGITSGVRTAGPERPAPR